MAQFEGHIVLPNAGDYLRNLHYNLLLEKRLTLGVNTLSELPPKIRDNILLFEERIAQGATYQDAEDLAMHEGLRPDRLREDNDFNNRIAEMCG